MKKLILPFSLIFLLILLFLVFALRNPVEVPLPQPTPEVETTESASGGPITKPLEISQIEQITEITAVEDINDLEVSKDGKKIYIPSFDENKIYVIDTEQNFVSKEIKITAPYSLAISPDQKQFFIANDKQEILVFDVKTNQNTAAIKVGSKPYDLVFSHDGKRVFVTNNFSDSVSVIDVKENKVVTTITVSKKPRGIALAASGNFLYVANYDGASISVISTNSLTEVGKILTSGRPNEVLAHPTKDFIYVTDAYLDQVLVIDANFNKIIAKIPVGKFPWGMDIDKTGEKLYTAGFGQNTISVINLLTNQLQETITTTGAFATESGFNKLALLEEQRKFYLVNTMVGKVLVYSF